MNPPDGPKSYGVRAYVDAWQVTDENIEAVAKWCDGNVYADAIDFLDAREATSTAEVGDWVVRGVTGLFSSHPDWSFCQHYYRADPPAPVTRGVLSGDELRVNDLRDGGSS